jgi:hypothetical protein
MPKLSGLWEAPKDFEQPSEGGTMSRRLFLQGAAGAGAGMMLGKSADGGHIDIASSTTDVNTFAKNFPEARAFRGIGSVSKDIRDNARNLIIQACSMHWDDEESEDSQIREVKISNEQWHEGLGSLIDHPYTNLRSLHTEGMMANNVERLFSKELDVEKIAALHRQMNQGQDRAKKQRSSPKADRRNYPLLVEAGADYVLQAAGKLELKGIEWPDSYELSRIASKEDWADKMDYICALRERAALEIIAAGRERIAYVFYGATHNWFRQITLWNHKHPNDRFSLIELLPDCMVDDETGNYIAFEDPEKKQPPPPPMAQSLPDKNDVIVVGG